nr:glycosyltransferase [Paracoccus sp. S-4012]
MAAFAEREARQAAARLKQSPEAVEWPRIAVVMPSLNAEGTIDASLLSILNQGYPSLEVTVVDGGSMDGTLDALARHADRLRVIVEPGLSQSGAVSLGFRRSEADLFCWLNADDLLLPGALFAVAGTWLASRADVIVGDCLHFREGSIVDLVTADRKHPPLDLARLLDVERNWLDGRYLTQPEVFFTRAAYERAGGTIDGGLTYAMDYDLWLRMAAAGVQSVTLPRPLAAFRRHAQQKTARQFDAFAELVSVRNSHPAAPRRADRASEMARGTLALCPWDAPEGSPLDRLLAGGKPIRLPCDSDGEGRGAVLLPPSLAREHPGPVLDILGLGGCLPQAAAVAEQLRLREGGSAAWVWTPEVEFTAKLRLSRLFGSVVPTDAASGAYLHHLDPRLAELPECSTLDPLRRAPAVRRGDIGALPRWLHLSAGDSFSSYLSHGARILRPASLYSLAQGDSDTARGFLASFDIVSMSAPGHGIPGLAHDAAALGCRTLVLTPGQRPGLVDGGGILLAPPPVTEAQATATITAAKQLPPASTGSAAHDLASRTAVFLAASG